MATVVNTRSVALANANPRLLNAANAAVILTASTPVFHVDTSNNVTPSSITLTAQLISIVGTVTFSSSGCTLTGISGNTATLTAANMTSSSATVTATITYRGQTFSSTVSINKVLDGATGPTGPQGSTGPAGTSASYVVVSTTNQVFSRANSTASYAPTSVTLTATPYGGTATYQWQYWTGSAWTNVASSGASSTYTVASGDFTDARTYRVQATINSVVYTDQITMVQVTGGTNGTNGANAVTGFLTNESVTFAATNSGTVSDFTPANGTFKVFDGVTDKTGASVTYSVASQTGCTVAITTAGAYSVSAMSADTATAVLQGVYNGVTLQQTLSLAKAKAGAQGSTGSTGATGSRGAGHWYASGSAWSDTTADGACPGGKVVGDVVTISNGSTFAMEKKWDGSAWNPTGVVIDGSLLISGSVKAASVDTTNLSIKDANGNVILNAGTAGGQLSASAAAPGTLNSAITIGSNGALSGGGGGQVTLTGIGFSGDPNASADIVLIGRNVTITGNTAQKTGGTNQQWDSDAYSANGFTGGAFVSAVANDATSYIMFGLNSDPTTDSSYTSIDYAIYLYGTSPNSILVFESGTQAGGNFGSWVAGDTFAVAYDGSSVKYLKNGAVFYTSASSASKTAGQTLFFDSSFYTASGKLKNIRFVPLSDNSAGVAANNAVNDASTGLSTRLLNNARNVLSGGAGLAVGSLTWDNTGARTGGYGVGINSFGIVGYNSAGSLTFSINASTGAVAVAGDISGSTGTFGAVTIGSSASFGQSAYDTGNGGWIQGGATPKWSMRASNGKYMRIDIGAGTFELSGVALSNFTMPTLSATITDSLATAKPNTSASVAMGSASVSVSNGTGTISTTWSVTNVSTDPTNAPYTLSLSGDTTSNVSVSGYTNSNTAILYTLQAVSTDANNQVVVKSIFKRCQFGTAV